METIGNPNPNRSSQALLPWGQGKVQMTLPTHHGAAEDIRALRMSRWWSSSVWKSGCVPDPFFGTGIANWKRERASPCLKIQGGDDYPKHSKPIGTIFDYFSCNYLNQIAHNSVCRMHFKSSKGWRRASLLQSFTFWHASNLHGFSCRSTTFQSGSLVAGWSSLIHSQGAWPMCSRSNKDSLCSVSRRREISQSNQGMVTSLIGLIDC